MTNTRTTTAKTNLYVRVLALIAALCVAASLLLVQAQKPARAGGSFIVNTTIDASDLRPGDGVCVGNISGSHLCTLRAAIEEANKLPGADSITFNIPSSDGFAAIKPVSPLPGIKDRVSMNGYTQPGASPNTLAKGTNAQPRIELDGSSATSSSGLFLGDGSSGSVVKGLVIHSFSKVGIVVQSDQNRIEGNFIGTGLDGATDAGNSVHGVEIFGGSNNALGGSSPAQRNLISGNDGVGVEIDTTGSTVPASNNRVQGNLIGTKKDGTTALGNGLSGVFVLGSNALFPNSVSNNTLSGNTVAFNGKDGVVIATNPLNIEGANGNGLFGNSIFANAEQGIDLADDGPTANDAGDTDKGPNALQNFPVLTSAKTVNGVTTVQGKLNGTPNKGFLVQFFSNPAGGNEGKKFVGQVGVSNDASGNASFTFSPATAVAAGQNVTATAILTSEANNFNTSEFSAPRTVASS
jgi:CSLREA domain-containing protein